MLLFLFIYATNIYHTPTMCYALHIARDTRDTALSKTLPMYSRIPYMVADREKETHNDNIV